MHQTSRYRCIRRAEAYYDLNECLLKDIIGQITVAYTNMMYEYNFLYGGFKFPKAFPSPSE